MEYSVCTVLSANRGPLGSEHTTVQVVQQNKALSSIRTCSKLAVWKHGVRTKSSSVHTRPTHPIRYQREDSTPRRSRWTTKYDHISTPICQTLRSGLAQASRKEGVRVWTHSSTPTSVPPYSLRLTYSCSTPSFSHRCPDHQGIREKTRLQPSTK